MKTKKSDSACIYYKLAHYGTFPFRIVCRTSRSMLPPDITQTILPLGILSVNAAATGAAPAPSATIWFLIIIILNALQICSKLRTTVSFPHAGKHCFSIHAINKRFAKILNNGWIPDPKGF